MEGGRMMRCVDCGKLVHAKHKRACCAECSPWGEAVWVEFYGAPGWVWEKRCYVGGEEPGRWCGVEWEPNGGFYCVECFERSKHSTELVR